TGESAPGSLLPLVRGEAGTHREQVIFGDFGTGVCLATDDWILAQGCRSDRPLNWYSTTGLRVSPDMVAGHFIPGVDIAQWRVPMKGPDLPSFLWRRQPFSPVPENLLELEPKIVAGLRDRLRTTLAKEGPPELPARLNL
ncbi:MAG: hypothetical protein ACKOEZ_12170, partial [Spartobacteria bacterium]